MKTFVILDTETTGLDDDAEIIEIAIIDQNGSVLLDTRVKSQRPIPRQATRIHGITDDDLIDAPTWPEVFPKVIEALESVDVAMGYNLNFDFSMLIQTSEQYGLEIPRHLIERRDLCVMHEYARIYNHGLWEKLSYAAYELGVSRKDLELHSAVGDCELTRRLWFKIKSNAEKRVRQREMRKSATAKKEALIPADTTSYPDFGMKRPDGYITLSKLKISEMHLYEYAGKCCSAYGDLGHLFKPKEKK